MSDRAIWAVRAAPRRGREAVRDRQGKLVRRRAPYDIYVRAATAAGAIATASRNCFDPNSTVTGPARIATPQELGCKWMA